MENKYLEDLKEIKEMMSKSSRFISLSGWSGVAAGVTALAGLYAVDQVLSRENARLLYYSGEGLSEPQFMLVCIAACTIVVAAGAAIFFTTQKAKIENQPIWDAQSRRLTINLLIPLITGGIFSLMLLSKGNLEFVMPTTLIFYGLALVNASRYTLHEIRSLGILEIIIGLCAMQWLEVSHYLWGLGFGILHIAYGIYIRIKYKQ
ncbi:MAG: hypothetical protein R2809_08480 [Flavobacteriales bacterium]